MILHTKFAAVAHLKEGQFLFSVT